ncbi:MAG: Formamidopyrimidine-DNA glycosylase [Candidatus Woesebacteria bacterium GW2011_GWB1_43_14]|uniref:Formamidopyrimidine-DNA glycosylase n=1 Tax=Candidatus Woesebacteria bacterium GW2011_GWB1_43_14 TaxID=1618578 RepID=A0A0G1DMJ3_9BACT|nr:MAG: Formamidopyrimidine-DNA glycosylase [Candidatus Woesebacteria bacterium GW2011_GWC1_42_9]KKS98864.1 MAG: Formamidopyrimidine-DNA glycosylase [Candidatus Woesebacteria bacterium GW2011_GWB1_43_14]
MPELPEVETIRIQLDKFLVGHKIVNVTVTHAKIFQGDKTKIVGAKIKSVRRFAKILVIDLDNKLSLAIHLKMTGQLIYRGPKLSNPPKLASRAGGAPGKHTRVVFDLDKNGKLFFNDLRIFGWIRVVKSDFVLKLGPEPLRDLTLKKFVEILSSTKKMIKVLLLDQSKISGIGNIYANEALLLAKIHPARPANSLSKTETVYLYKAIIRVLKKGLKLKGSSETNYVTAMGDEGEYNHHFVAYSLSGKKCSQCKSGVIKRIVVGGRGTFICPVCQKK